MPRANKAANLAVSHCRGPYNMLYTLQTFHYSIVLLAIIMYKYIAILVYVYVCQHKIDMQTNTTALNCIIIFLFRAIKTIVHKKLVSSYNNNNKLSEIEYK